MYKLVIREKKNFEIKDLFEKNFEVFDKAYSLMRNKLKEYGLSSDGIFDGKGHIKAMEEYNSSEIKNILDSHSEGYFSDFFSSLKSSNELIEAIVLNTNDYFVLPFEYEYNNKIKYEFNDNILKIEGIGLSNNLPLVESNILKSDEKHYYFYVKDCFNGSNEINEFYLDLIEC